MSRCHFVLDTNAADVLFSFSVIIISAAFGKAVCPTMGWFESVFSIAVWILQRIRMNTHHNRMSEDAPCSSYREQSQTIIRACRAYFVSNPQWSARRLSETDGQALSSGIR